MFSLPSLPSFSNPLADAIGGDGTKLKLKPESGSDFTFPYNPTQFSLDRGVQWDDSKPMKQDYGILNFTGGNSDTISFSAMLDTTEETGKDIMSDVKKLYAFTEASVSDGTYNRPPIVVLTWGDIEFSGVITSIKVDFTLFSDKGKPLRADVSVSMMGRWGHNQKKDKFFAAFRANP